MRTGTAKIITAYSEGDSDGKVDFSTTNIQVKGVDEQVKALEQAVSNVNRTAIIINSFFIISSTPYLYITVHIKQII